MSVLTSGSGDPAPRRTGWLSSGNATRTEPQLSGGHSHGNANGYVTSTRSP